MPHTLYLTSKSERFSPLFSSPDPNEVAPPQELWVQFENPEALRLLERLPERSIAVVGTREPQVRTLTLIREEIQKLKNENWIVLSGFARGVDSCAHDAAIEAGLPTLAVLGAGFDQLYPKQNEPLRERILKNGGLLITEYAPDVHARPKHFLDRNRLIALWSKVTVVAEARARSGALNTANWCRKLQRTTFAVPGFPNDPCFQGNQDLLDLHHATNFWGIHSLGQEWLELATARKAKRQKFDSKLLRTLQHQTILYGGATIESLRTAFRRDLTAFWKELESLMEQKKVIEENGRIRLFLKYSQDPDLKDS